MKSSENTLASLIAVEGNQWHYHIPRFQREYVWGKYNWSKLVEDIYDNDPGHYMGSIICVREAEELTPGSELINEVVDGQQRLTTLSLLLAAIYEKLNDLASSDPSLREDEDFIIKRNGIKKRLIKEVKTDFRKLPWGIFKSGALVYCLRVQPSTQEDNLADYQFILKEVGLLPDATCLKYAKVRRLYKAFDYFRHHTPDTLPELYDLLDRVSALSFIFITEASQSKAFMLFETLNYRGVPLSAIDIIKNKMLATLESKHAVSIETSYDEWLKLLENLPEDQDQDRFLRQFYNAFKFDPKIRVERITRATGSNIIAIYESLIKRDAKFIFEELIQKSRIYNQFLEPEDRSLSPLTSALVELGRIGAAPSYTLLIYLFSLPEDAFNEPNVKEKTVELLCKYYFRRNIVDYPNTRDLDSINTDLVERCRHELSEGRKLGYAFISQAILAGKGQPAPLEKLEEGLADSLFDNNESMARYALARLDETSHTREYAPNLWARNEKGLFVWTVEHIFPQGRNIPADWVKVIADGDKEEAERIQGEWVHCLGNLTLSGYNSRLSNQSFAKKQAESVASVFGMPINIGYRNGLALNNIPFSVDDRTLTLATTDRWTVGHIEARNTVMVDMLTRLFKFENEKGHA
jgi:hypothetical protein